MSLQEQSSTVPLCVTVSACTFSIYELGWCWLVKFCTLSMWLVDLNLFKSTNHMLEVRNHMLGWFGFI